MKSNALIALLADGQVHSGQSLARTLGVSRTAVWKQVRRASEGGFAVESIRGKGYRLITPVDLLDSDAIIARLPPELRSAVVLAVHEELDSTNAEIVRRRSALRDGAMPVCIANCQTAGRGRRGRPWQSPRGDNLYLSLGLTFRGGFTMLDGLSLVLGLAVAQAIEHQQVPGVRLKWPNDVYLNNVKIAGILVELQGELEEGVVQVVAGIGLNVHMMESDSVDQNWTSLALSFPSRNWQRNAIAADVIAEVLRAAERFAVHGFSGFRAEWQSRDIFFGAPLAARDGELSGIGQGVDTAGNYLVEVNGSVEKVRAGEISLRAKP